MARHNCSPVVRGALFLIMMYLARRNRTAVQGGSLCVPWCCPPAEGHAAFFECSSIAAPAAPARASRGECPLLRGEGHLAFFECSSIAAPAAPALASRGECWLSRGQCLFPTVDRNARGLFLSAVPSQLRPGVCVRCRRSIAMQDSGS